MSFAIARAFRIDHAIWPIHGDHSKADGSR